MRTNTGRQEPAALLDVEESPGFYRPETTDIPDTLVDDETGLAEGEEPFLRGKRRVPPRRRIAPRFAMQQRWMRVLMAVAIAVILGLAALAAWETRSLLRNDARFMLATPDNVQIDGDRVVPREDVLAIFQPDLGHSIFRVPLAVRRNQLQEIPWVKLASVMRLWPDRLRVTLVERTPVAFARDGDGIRVVDEDGVLLDLPDGVAEHYSFPVLTGISAADPLSTRVAHMQLYRQFANALDADGGNASATLSEVDVSDPEDIRAVFSGGSPSPIVHFGDADFLARYRAYQAHLKEWRQQYPQLSSVDMRYGRQIVLGTSATAAAAKALEAPAPHPAIEEIPATPIKHRVQQTSAGGKRGDLRSAHHASTGKTRHHVTHRSGHRIVHHHATRRGVRPVVSHLGSSAAGA